MGTVSELGLGRDLKRKIAERSRYLKARDRVARVCHDFSLQIDSIFRAFIENEYGGIDQVTVEKSHQDYKVKLGELRPPDTFRVAFTRVALHGKQLAIALRRPAHERPEVHYVVSLAGHNPVDSDDSVHLRGRSVKRIEFKDFHAQQFDGREFHELLIQHLIDRL